MGTVALMSRAGAQSHVDPADNVPKDDAQTHNKMRKATQKHERFDVPFRHSFLLHPGTLVLVPTLEWVVIPKDLQGVVTARSSWAREGLSIATATLINPGYKGIVTLELANLGQIPITLYPGLRLAQIAFYELTQGQGPDIASREDDMGQFNFSFEPSAGDVVRGDESFALKWASEVT
jgi:dCTP deaminase